MVKLKEEYEQKFRELGFIEAPDPQFPWEKDIISMEQIEELGLYNSEVPKLLWGSTGINKGFCIFTGDSFVWINATTPEQAVEFANQIVAFEPQ